MPERHSHYHQYIHSLLSLFLFVYRGYSGLLALFTTGGGPSSSGYGSGAPGGGRANPVPGGGDVLGGDVLCVGNVGETLNAGCPESGGGTLPSFKGVFGGRGGGSKLSRGEFAHEAGRSVENCSPEVRPGETNSPECRGGMSLMFPTG